MAMIKISVLIMISVLILSLFVIPMFYWIITIVPDEEIINVITLDGVVKGRVLHDSCNGTFYGFQGIPYAQPPIKSDRFKNPVKNQNWNGILDATEPKSKCLQPNYDATAEIGDEDCLYLNIFTPQINRKKLKPVFIYIHGDDLVINDRIQYAPEFFTEKDIVLVTINYRLGIYGLMNLVDTNCEESVANLGFKDQIWAMEWVQHNIVYFGGDPTEVTLCGEGTGGASVHLHMLSPLSSGLFQRIIILSGTALYPIEFVKNTAYNLAKQLQISSQNCSEMMNKLRTVSTEALFHIAKSTNWIRPNNNNSIRLGPVIEKKSATSFLYDYPMNIIQTRKYSNIPMMIGNFGYQLDIVNNLTNDIPFHLMNRDKVAEEVMTFYNFTNQENDTNMRIEYYHDLWYRYPCFRTAIKHIKYNSNSTIYYYEYTDNVKLNLINVDNFNLRTKSFYYDKVLLNIMNLWIDFIKTGKPIINWQPFLINKNNFANVTNNGTEFGIIGDYRLDFWRNIYEKYKFSS